MFQNNHMAHKFTNSLSTRKQLSALIKQQMITEKLKQDNEKLTKESLKLKILYYKARLAQFK